MKNKLVCLILAAVIAAVPLASCSGETGGADGDTLPAATESATEPVTERVLPNLEPRDFGGYEFTFAGTNGMSGVFYVSDDITAESETGEPINDAIYRRNLEIEETYGIKIKSSLSDNICGEIEKTHRSGDNAYQGMWGWQSQVCISARAGYLADLYKLPNFDPSGKWWDKKSEEAFSVGGSLYFITGELSLWAMRDTYAVLFNKELFSTYSDENPYELVTDGEWVIDDFIALARQCSGDIDGDGEWTSKDMYGFVGQPRDLYTYMVGCGITALSKDDDNYYVDTLYDDRSVSVFDKIAPLMYDDTVMINPGRVLDEYGGDGLAVWTASRKEWFAGDRILFYVAGINSVTELRDMETPFGILPMPKYDAAQSEYRCLLTEYCQVAAITSVNPDTEAAGYVLEAMGALSSNEVKTAYYDTLLKRKISRDDESEAMLDIIFASRAFDPAMFYNVGGYLNLFINLGTAKSYDFASAYAKNQKSAAAAIKKLNGDYEKLAANG